MIKMNLNLKIAEFGINKSQLADATNVGLNTISRYCNNSYEKLDKGHLDKFCKYFNCGVDELLEYVDEENLDIEHISPNYKIKLPDIPDPKHNELLDEYNILRKYIQLKDSSTIKESEGKFYFNSNKNKIINTYILQNLYNDQITELFNLEIKSVLENKIKEITDTTIDELLSDYMQDKKE